MDVSEDGFGISQDREAFLALLPSLGALSMRSS